MNRLAILLLAALSLPCGGAALAQTRCFATVAPHVDAVRQTIRTTAMAGFRAIVDRPGGALLIDVREPEEGARGRIPGTVNIPRGMVDVPIRPALGHPAPVDSGRPIDVQGMRGNRVILAPRQLADVGFTNVVAVGMSFPDWQRLSPPIVQL